MKLFFSRVAELSLLSLAKWEGRPGMGGNRWRQVGWLLALWIGWA